MSSENQNTFHLAITMAGAVSAGAYTAGVMDYLLEVLDTWETLKTNKSFQDKIPTHNVKIEILSGASAGGMTACISSILLHLKEKNHVDFAAKEPDRKKNRLYNSWVNLGYGSKSLTGNKAIFELLGDTDVKEVEELKRDIKIEKEGMVPFPVSAFNSSIIRKIAEDATNLTGEEKEDIKAGGLPAYVAADFDVFVTLTSLKGFDYTIRLQEETTGGYRAAYTITDHRDVMLFNFGSTNKKDGTINIDLATETKDSEGLSLLRNAAVSTGAFPIGLEYGFIERKTEYINKNFLMREIHPHGKKEDIVSGNTYASAMIDGGLINNEPFELTERLLQKRLKEQYKTLSPQKLKKKYTMLLIDPFPSETVEISTNNGHDLGNSSGFYKQYPYSLMGALGKLISVARSQLLVKSLFKQDESLPEDDSQIESLIKDAYDEDEINTFLVAPRRRFSGTDKIAEGDKAIACGTLFGFGGFLDKRFREHDFFLGRANCKSFLLNHFKFKAAELKNKNSPFYQSYSEKARKIFLIKNENTVTTDEEWLPIIPDFNLLLEEVEDKGKYINEIYDKNEFPQMTETEFDELFDELEPRISDRINLIKECFLDGKWDFATDILLFLNDAIDRVTGKNFLCEKLKPYILDELKKWQIVK